MNFDNFLIHCSSLGLCMVDPKGKSNKQKYEEIKEQITKVSDKYEKDQNAYDSMRGDFSETATKKLDVLISTTTKLSNLHKQLKDLEKVKNEVNLSETCKRHLIRLFVIEKYGRVDDIKSKYLLKGTELEEDAITTYARATQQMYKKSKEQRKNGYVIGEMDFTDPSRIRLNDTKVSWDIFTFWDSAVKPLDDIYYWQAQAYMWLWELEEAKIIKVLLNTPEKMIAREERALLAEHIGSEEQWELKKADLRKKMTYDDIPIEERIIEIPVYRNQEDIDKIPPRIIQCREWLNNLNNNKVGNMYEKVVS